jgi:hypothetical protein
MAISSDPPYAQRAAMVSTANNDPHPLTAEKMNRNADTEPAMNEKINGHANGHTNQVDTATMTIPKTSIDTSGSSAKAYSIDTAVEFTGDVNTNNEIPTQVVLKSVEDMTVFDKDGRIVPFKNLYSGPNVTRRVLIIFIRHFFCGVCSLSSLTFRNNILTDAQ